LVVFQTQVSCAIICLIAIPSLAALARKASIFKKQRFSDQALLIVDYDFAIYRLKEAKCNTCQSPFKVSFAATAVVQWSALKFWTRP